MGLAMLKNDRIRNDLDKKATEESLQHMLDQLRLLDQKLTTSIDSEVWGCFQSHYKEISETKKFIRGTIECYHD
ncbi:hypothetical protein BME96_09915 [Virgibacillus halodenitrificans]|uniref:Uncharacterized protein n=1 Tax=Virgibacillus halodenitrificans TaxID=1482 RepID=A0AAC9J0P2_VIRHA|nr:hypothetical protein [Virgibacillus halodenitrificans]APC48468.1 hypothetical protein BME96_09915 [Virgibacillus halodenitrificans]